MAEFFFKNELIDYYINQFTSQIVSESGIPSDKYHLGKIILKGMKQDPDFVIQIDGGEGISETAGSLLRRSIKCATSFRNMGLKTGDVIVLMAPHHLDLAVPIYAAMYLGISAAAGDSTLGVDELKHAFNAYKPKIIFCQSEKVQDVRNAVALLGLDSKIISFDKSPHATSLSEMMEKHGGQCDVENFKPADFDPEETIAYLVSTSGTTGLPKYVALSHRNIATSGPLSCVYAKQSPNHKMALIVAPLHAMSAFLNYILSPVFKTTRLQSSHHLSMEHILDMIEKYKPTNMIINPAMMTTLVNAAKKQNSDFSSFQILYIGGSAVPITLVEELKRMVPETIVANSYGLSEIGASAFYCGNSLPGSCGIPFAHLKYKLVNIETGEEIKEPNKPGELWVKAPGGFKGYHNNPDATAEALSKDGFFKTGDILYRDENWNFYYVDRIKTLLKYRNNQISPLELETVIRQHPGVLDVVVTSLPDAECGDLPVACVIPHLGAEVTAEEIKKLVKDNLTDTKQLRGGVFFFEEFPTTSTTKVHRRKLQEIVIAKTRKQVKM